MDAHAKQLLNHVIRPTLQHLGVNNIETKAWLLLGTATVVTTAPTVRPWSEHFGIYAISQADHVRVWDEFLAKDADLASTVRGLASQHRFLQQPDAELNTNLAYATAIAAMVYEAAVSAWPTRTDDACLATLWTQNFWPHKQREVSEFRRQLTAIQQRGGAAAAA